MAKQQFVIAFFESEDAADAAVKELKSWDKASKEIKLGAIGVLAKDSKGKIKTQKLGARKTKGGAVLGALAGVLTGGVSVVGGAVVGVLAAPDEVESISAKLAELGGAPETHEVTEEALEQVETAVENAPEGEAG